MKEELLYTLRENLPEETVARLGEIFLAAQDAPEDRIPALEQALASLLAREAQQHRLYVKSAPSGRIHLVYMGGGLYLLTIRGFRKLLWEALMYEGDMWFGDVCWVENAHLVLFTLENIVHREKSSCICSYAPGDAFLIRRPWRPIPGEGEVLR